MRQEISIRFAAKSPPSTVVHFSMQGSRASLVNSDKMACTCGFAGPPITHVSGALGPSSPTAVAFPCGPLRNSLGNRDRVDREAEGAQPVPREPDVETIAGLYAAPRSSRRHAWALAIASGNQTAYEASCAAAVCHPESEVTRVRHPVAAHHVPWMSCRSAGVAAAGLLVTAVRRIASGPRRMVVISMSSISEP